VAVLATLLGLLGCAPKPVDERQLAYPVLVFTSTGPEPRADATALCTTTQLQLDAYYGLEVMDLKGRRYTVIEVKTAAKPSFWKNLTGTAPMLVALKLKPGPALDLPGAKATIASHVMAEGSFLENVEGGRATVLAMMNADPDLGTIFRRFGMEWSSEAIRERIQRESDLRNGIVRGPDGRHPH
jgi:hypothetical protein